MSIRSVHACDVSVILVGSFIIFSILNLLRILASLFALLVIFIS